MAQAPMPDLVATPPGQGTLGGASTSGGSSGAYDLAVPMDVPLTALCETARFQHLDKLESYYRARQDDHKRFDWDGRYNGYGEEAAIKPGWFVPYAQRKPSARYDLARVIVHRITSMLFGTDRFPEIRVEGDEDAEDFVKALCTESRLSMRMIEARNFGGAEGTACASFCFREGHPRTEVHNAKHVTVLRWSDEQMLRPGAVLKAYAYPRRVWDPTDRKLKEKVFYFARYWDENQEILWEPIPEEVAKLSRWPQLVRSTTSVHNFGFCPFYWCQNVPDSVEPDGDSDYEGMTDLFDQINQVISATVKGTKANVDPTLVVHMDPAMNSGSVFKGSENALFSPGGASYLELSGAAVKAGVDMAEKLRSYALERAGVVIPDDEKRQGAESAAHLRMKFAPMLAECDARREQYGDYIIRPMLRDMLRAAKLILSTPAVPVIGPDGEVIAENKATIFLPPRMQRPEGADADADLVATPRKPGNSEEVTLNWNPYFPPTWDDISKAATAVLAANGQKPVISQRTAVQAVQSLFGVNDVDAEMEEIGREAEEAHERAMETMMGPEEGAFGSKAKDEDDAEE